MSNCRTVIEERANFRRENGVNPTRAYVCAELMEDLAKEMPWALWTGFYGFNGYCFGMDFVAIKDAFDERIYDKRSDTFHLLKLTDEQPMEVGREFRLAAAAASNQ